MNADPRRFENPNQYPESILTEKIIGVFYSVYNELGFGFLECVYHRAMQIALAEVGLKVYSQQPIAVKFRGNIVGDFLADLVVEDRVLLELKAVREFEDAHEAQILNYLRATQLEIGLLMNFGPKPKFKRFAYANTRKTTNPHSYFLLNE